MKKIITLITLLFVTNNYATDRLVDPTLSSGNGTTIFTTITAAINAAVNGDRIIIASNTYNEAALTIGKSLQIMPQTPGTTINFNANITIAGFDGMKTEISGINLGIYNLITTNYSTNNSTDVNVSLIDCVFNQIIFNQDFYTLNMFNSTSNSLIFKAGYIIKSNIINSFRVEDEVGQSTSLIKQIKILANIIGSTIYVYNDNYPLLIANNEINGGILLKRWNPSNDVTNFIHNNNFNGGFYISSRNVPRYNVIITSNFWNSANFEVATNPNNYLVSGLNFNDPGSSFGGLFGNNSTNEYPNPNVPGFFEWSYNYGVTFGSPAVSSSSPLNYTLIAGNNSMSNSGNPNHRFYDIDLTINDIGVSGGPYSQLNYNAANPNNSKAFIFDIDMPIDLFPTQTVDIKAKGYHKN